MTAEQRLEPLQGIWDNRLSNRIVALAKARKAVEELLGLRVPKAIQTKLFLSFLHRKPEEELVNFEELKRGLLIRLPNRVSSTAGSTGCSSLGRTEDYFETRCSTGSRLLRTSCAGG